MRLPLCALILSATALPAAEPTWDQVSPILSSRCTECHGVSKHKGGLRLDSPEWIAKGSKEGPVLVPGKPEQSPLYKLAALPAEDEERMPPKGERLSADQLDLIKRWIAAGAPAGAPAAPAQQAAPDPQKHSSLAPAVPESALQALRAAQIGVNVLEHGWLDIDAGHLPKDIAPAQLDLLAQVAPAIAFLDLADSGITDAGLVTVGRCSNLLRLHLERTAISDAGLSALAPCRQLQVINIGSTTVSDAGLPALAALPALRRVDALGSAITAQNQRFAVVIAASDLPSGAMVSVKDGKRAKK